MTQFTIPKNSPYCWTSV